MKRLLLRSKNDTIKEETAALDAIAVQEAEEEIRFDHFEVAAVPQVEEEGNDMLPVSDSMVLNELDLDYNAFLEEEEEEEDMALEGADLMAWEDEAHMEVMDDNQKPREDALPITVLPIDDDVNAYCQCAEALESTAPETRWWPEPLMDDHWFSKHYVLSATERAQIQQLPMELWGETTAIPLLRRKSWWPRWKSSQRSINPASPQQWDRRVAGRLLWRSSGESPPHCASCRRPISTALRPIWVTPDRVECEVVLFTTGGVILWNDPTTLNAAGPRQQKKLYCIVFWSDVAFMEPSLADADASIQITTSLHPKTNLRDDSERGQATREPSSGPSLPIQDEPPSVTLLFPSTWQRDLCYRMVTAAFLQYLTYQRAQEQFNRAKSHPDDDDDDRTPVEPLGWQYQYVYQPYFTLAVTNRWDLPTRTNSFLETNDGINQLDAYHGMAPLHYAIYYNHVPAMVALLELGADPNVADETNHYTPLDYCALHQSSLSTRELLQQHGATQTTLKIQEPRMNDGKDIFTLQGELFGRVAGTQQVIQERREHREKVESIMQEQRNNIQLLQQRGEKIETLSAGAADLHAQTQDYASMAQQLKQKMKQKQQRQWLPF
jgi:Ankyrin repeats (many copies)/Synaptobrevin